VKRGAPNSATRTHTATKGTHAQRRLGPWVGYMQRRDKGRNAPGTVSPGRGVADSRDQLTRSGTTPAAAASPHGEYDAVTAKVTSLDGDTDTVDGPSMATAGSGALATVMSTTSVAVPPKKVPTARVNRSCAPGARLEAGSLSTALPATSAGRPDVTADTVAASELRAATDHVNDGVPATQTHTPAANTRMRRRGIQRYGVSLCLDAGRRGMGEGTTYGRWDPRCPMRLEAGRRRCPKTATRPPRCGALTAAAGTPPQHSARGRMHGCLQPPARPPATATAACWEHRRCSPPPWLESRRPAREGTAPGRPQPRRTPGPPPAPRAPPSGTASRPPAGSPPARTRTSRRRTGRHPAPGSAPRGHRSARPQWRRWRPCARTPCVAAWRGRPPRLHWTA
jgi:hypothetical protein